MLEPENELYNAGPVDMSSQVRKDVRRKAARIHVDSFPHSKRGPKIP